MTEAWGYFALGLLLLALGGDSIVKGASGLAQHRRQLSKIRMRWQLSSKLAVLPPLLLKHDPASRWWRMGATGRPL